MLVRLIHPRLGIVAQDSVRAGFNKEKIVTAWQKRYGQKFFECSVEEDEVAVPKKMVIYDNVTHDYYETIKEAAYESGFSYNQVTCHLKRTLSPVFNRYRFFWKEKDCSPCNEDNPT